MAPLLQTQRLAAPPSEARAAEALVFQRLFPGGPRDNVTDETRQNLTAAAGSLSNPRRFCAEFLKLFLPLVRNSDLLQDGLQPWQITVVGERASATTESRFPNTSSTFEANYHESGWIVHSVYGSPQTPPTAAMQVNDDGELIESQALRYFETPELLLAEMHRCGVEKGYAGLFSMVDDDAVAGMMLQSTSMFAAMAQIPVLAKDDPNTPAILAMGQIVERHKRKVAPLESLAAHANLNQVMFLAMGLNVNSRTEPDFSADEMRRQLVLAAGVLEAPRPFCVEILAVFHDLDADSEENSESNPE
jgi:hypothetical protein